MAAHQAPPSLGFSRQEYWSGLPLPSPMHESEKWKWSRSVVSNSSWPHGLQPTRLLHPWDFLRDITLLTKICLLKASSHVWIWELDYKESWVLKNCCFWTVLLKKTLESPLDYKVINPVHPIGNQSWIITGRTDAEAETLILWPCDVKNWFTGKHPDIGQDWRQEEKGMTEDEMVGWHHWLNGHEFEQALGVGARQGSLVCCSPWGHKESDTTERLNWNELNWTEQCVLLLLLLLSCFSHTQLCATPEMAAHQAPPSLGFSRQEHWNGLPFPSPMHESEKWKWSRSVVSDS